MGTKTETEQKKSEMSKKKKKKKKKKKNKNKKIKRKEKRKKEETKQTPSVRLRPISTLANFDFGQFDFGQLAEVELSEVELAEVEHPLPKHQGMRLQDLLYVQWAKEVHQPVVNDRAEKKKEPNVRVPRKKKRGACVELRDAMD